MHQNPVDGIDLLPAIDGVMTARPGGIGFEARNRMAWIGNRYKLVKADANASFELFDLLADPGEKRDLAPREPELVQEMRRDLEAWRASCKRSLAGADY